MQFYLTCYIKNDHSNLLFPFHFDQTFHSTEAISISLSPSSNFYAFLYQKSIQIYDNLDPSFPILKECSIGSYIKEMNNLNTWFQWINDHSFAFGSKQGNIFFFNSFDQEEPIFFSLDSNISSVFSIHDFLAVCTSNLNMIFFQEAKLFSKNEIECGMSDAQISMAKCYKNSLFSCYINNKPSIAKITKNMIEQHSKIPIRMISKHDINFFAINPIQSKIAYSTKNNSIKVVKIYDFNSIEYSFDNMSDDPIKDMFWFNHYKQLFVLLANGSIFIYDLVNDASFHFSLKSLSTAISFEYDDLTKTLIYIDGKSLFRLFFCNLSPPFCFSSSSIYSLLTGKLIASINNAHFKTDCIISKKLFPILHVVESLNGDIAIFGNNFLSTITANIIYFSEIGSSGEPNTHKKQFFFSGMIWCNNMLFVFYSIKESHFLDIYSSKLEQIGSVSSPHPASYISSSVNNKNIIISHDNKFTILDINYMDHLGNQVKPSRNQNSNIIKIPSNSTYTTCSNEWDGLKITITTFTIHNSICSAIFGFDNDIILHLSNYKLVSFSTGSIIEKNVKKIWYSLNPHLIFVLINAISDKPYIKIMNQELVYEIQKVTNIVCSLGMNFILLDNKSNFFYESFPFTTYNFLFEISKRELENNAILNCYSFLKTILHSKEFSFLIKKLCIFAVQKSLVTSFLKLIQLFNSEQQRKLFNSLDEYLQEVIFKIVPGCDMTMFFHVENQQIQKQIIVQSSPRDFLSIIEKNGGMIQQFTQNEISSLMNDMILSMKWLKLMQFLQLFPKIELPPILMSFRELKSLKFKQIIKILEKDNNQWPIIDRNYYFKMLGLSFIVADLTRWSASCFCLIQDQEKLMFLIDDNKDLRHEIQVFINENKTNYHSAFLKSLLEA